jgi:hypothetical protein
MRGGGGEGAVSCWSGVGGGGGKSIWGCCWGSGVLALLKDWECGVLWLEGGVGVECVETGSGLPDRLPLRLLALRWEGNGPFMPGGEPTVSTGGGGGGGRVSLPALMLRPRVGVLVVDETVGVL